MQSQWPPLVRVAAALLLAVASCATPEAPDGASATVIETAPPREATITVDHVAVVRFQSDWNEVVVTGPVYAGGKLRLQFDAARLPSCRGTKYGMPAWSILAYVKFDGGAATSRPLTAQGAFLEASVDVPETAGDVEVWFYANDYYGCKEWDTNLGENYDFTVAAPAVAVPVRFTTDWLETSDAPLTQGGLLEIDYSPSRLSTCRMTKNGARAWNLYASWRFMPGGETGTVALYGGDPWATNGEAGYDTPTVNIPDDATSVSFWFSNSDEGGCVAWDSDFGANYEFPVVPSGVNGLSVGWIGDLDFVLIGAGSDQHRGAVDPVYHFDAWQGQGVAGIVEVQTWIAGLTDQSYASPAAAAAAASAIDAEVVTTAVAQPLPLHFQRQQGNNFVYAFRLNDLRNSLSGVMASYGNYRYSFRFSADDGSTWKAAFDQDGGRRLVLAAALDCTLFPAGGPPECPKSTPVGWVGSWGGRFNHACQLVAGIPDPVLFTKSSLGHDCMVLTAEVYVPGITDAGGASSAIRAEVETNLGFGGGPLGTPVFYPLAFDGQAGNNFRYAWSPAQNVGMSNKGDYQFRFRFSADGGKSWTVLGKDGTGFRNLRIANDSFDIVPEQTCDGVQSWDSATNSAPSCVPWGKDADYDALYCEHWLNGLGRGQWSHNGTTMTWLEAYVRIGSPLGSVLGAGLWVSYLDGSGGPAKEAWSYGNAIEPGYYRTGFTTSRSGPGGGSFAFTVEAFATFIDVQRPSGVVDRLWQSASGQNYTVAAAWPSPGYVLGIGSGSVEYVPDGSPVLSAKWACQP